MGFLNAFSSESRTTTNTTTQNAGFTDVSGYASAIQGDNNSVQFIDGGALKIAGEIADRAFNQVDMSTRSAFGGIAQAVEAVSEAAREESENMIKDFKALAIVGVVAWAVVSIAK